MLEGKVKFYKVVNGKMVEVFCQNNMILRPAKNINLRSHAEPRWSAHLDLLIYEFEIDDIAFKDAYYTGDLPAGASLIYNLGWRNWIITSDAEGSHFSVTSDTLLGPYNIYALAFQINKEPNTYPISLIRFVEPLIFTESDSFVVNYQITMRW